MTTKRSTTKKAEPVARSRRGRTSDIAKYELFAEWAREELGFTVNPEQAQFTVLQYKHFQASDLNRKFNADKTAARAKAATPTTTSKKAPASPAKKVAAKAAPAKPAAKTTTRSRKAAA